MRGIITKDGILKIQRKSNWKEQHCPYVKNDAYDTRCGDWCPLLEEPAYINRGFEHQFRLCACNRTLWFDEFMDERE